jgi:signal transduction histidine kinase
VDAVRAPDRLKTAGQAGLGGLLTAAVVFQAHEIATSWGARYWPFGAAVGALVGGLALIRRRNRMWTAAAALAVAASAVLVAALVHLPAEPGPATALGLAALVGSGVRTLPAPAACAVAAAGAAVTAGGLLAVPTSAIPVLSLATVLAGAAAGLAPRLLAARRRAMAERVRRAERLDLARELHDVVAHHITGIVLQAQAAQVVTRRHPDRAADTLSGIESAGARALMATRRVVDVLRDTGPASADRGPLRDLIEDFGLHGARASLRLAADPDGWPPEVSTTVHRVVRESLTNVLRHARQAREVTVEVTQDAAAVTVTVEDDAPSSAGRSRAGYGLIGMRERLEALGGTLAAGPRPGSGWSVRASIPVER